MAIDVYPQWLRLTPVVEATPGTYIESETRMPVFLESELVMEILAIQYDLIGGNFTAQSTQAYRNVAQVLNRSTTGNLAISDSRVIDKVVEDRVATFAEATETAVVVSTGPRTHLHQFAQGGKGFLYAGELMHLGVISVATQASILGANARVLYRLVRVTLAELVGLVQESAR